MRAWVLAFCLHPLAPVYLDLSLNPLGDAGVRTFARLLEGNVVERLTHLDLRSVNMGSGGADALFRGLRKNWSVTEL